MFSTIVHFTCLSWPRQGVDGSPLLEFSYEASPTVVSWAPNDIPAHIDPIKNAGLGPFLPLLASSGLGMHVYIGISRILPCTFVLLPLDVESDI